MTENIKPRKPYTITYAEGALWLWTVWTCVFGTLQSWKGIGEIEDQLSQLQGLLTIDPKTIEQAILAGYGLVALLSIWMIWEIRRGKDWARKSILVGFAFQALFALFPPYHGLLEYLTAIPDFGLQIYALWLLYTAPGNSWFQNK